MANVFANGYNSNAAYILEQAINILNEMECHDAVGELAAAIEAYSAEYARPAAVEYNHDMGVFAIEFAEE